MRLSFRHLEPADFDACWPIFRARHRFSADSAQRIREAWQNLLPARAMIGAVIEDLDRPASATRAVAFGASVFVTDAAISSARAAERPYGLTAFLLGHAEPGSPVLSGRRLERANAGAGLNLVIVQTGWDPSSSTPEERLLIADCLMRSFQEVHRGFKLREMLNEVYGRFECEWCTSGGNWTLRSDYDRYFISASDVYPTEEMHPFLLGATAAEATIGSFTASMFAHTTPVLRFSGRQRRVLELALRGWVVSQIAARTALNEDSVRNCFRAAYSKAMLHPAVGGIFHEDRHKRTTLMTYLKQHMEELRP